MGSRSPARTAFASWAEADTGQASREKLTSATFMAFFPDTGGSLHLAVPMPRNSESLRWPKDLQRAVPRRTASAPVADVALDGAPPSNLRRRRIATRGPGSLAQVLQAGHDA